MGIISIKVGNLFTESSPLLGVKMGGNLGGGGNIFTMVFALLGILGLMLLVFFGLRMLNRRISTSGGRLKVVDRATLGRDSMLLIVSVCGKLILVGVSSQRVEKIADLDMTEEEYVESAFQNARNGGGAKVLPFSDILSSFIGKKKSETTLNQERIERKEEDKTNNENDTDHKDY